MIRRSLGLGTLLLTVAALPAVAQTGSATPASAPGTVAVSSPAADSAGAGQSLEIPRRYAAWFWATQTDSLWAHMSEELRGKVGSAGAIGDKAFEVMGRYGAETAVLEETVTQEGEELVYLRTIELEAAPGPMVFIWRYRPDGTINNVNMRPKE